MIKILPTCEGNKFINSVSLKRIFVVVQLLSCIQLFMIPWIASHQASLSFSNSWCLLRLTSFDLMMPSNHVILCCPLFLLLSSFPSIRVFSYESVLHIRWPKYQSFSFSINIHLPVNTQGWSLGLTGLISFLSKGLSRVFSSTIVQRHRFFGTQPFLLSSSHICTWLLEKP